MKELHIKLDFGTGSIEGGRNGPYDGQSTPMKGNNDKPINSVEQTAASEEAYEGHVVTEATNRMKRILDAKYEKADLKEVINSNKKGSMGGRWNPFGWLVWVDLIE